VVLEAATAGNFCNIQKGDTIAVIWGGSVGQFAIRSAFLLGAVRMIAINTALSGLRLPTKRADHYRLQGFHKTNIATL
jgi:threonine dehydrogenase-like Zn-dependent dehydrogenase